MLRCARGNERGNVVVWISLTSDPAWLSRARVEDFRCGMWYVLDTEPVRRFLCAGLLHMYVCMSARGYLWRDFLSAGHSFGGGTLFLSMGLRFVGGPVL